MGTVRICQKKVSDCWLFAQYSAFGYWTCVVLQGSRFCRPEPSQIPGAGDAGGRGGRWRLDIADGPAATPIPSGAVKTGAGFALPLPIQPHAGHILAALAGWSQRASHFSQVEAASNEHQVQVKPKRPGDESTPRGQVRLAQARHPRNPGKHPKASAGDHRAHAFAQAAGVVDARELA